MFMSGSPMQSCRRGNIQQVLLGPVLLVVCSALSCVTPSDPAPVWPGRRGPQRERSSGGPRSRQWDRACLRLRGGKREDTAVTEKRAPAKKREKERKRERKAKDRDEKILALEERAAKKRRTAKADEASTDKAESNAKKTRRADKSEGASSPPSSGTDKSDRAQKMRKEGEDKLLVKNFRVSDVSVRALAKDNITALFPIQASTFDKIYDGHDLIARARTGTGKTLAFALPINELLVADMHDTNSRRARGRAPAALVVIPTRELCLQVSRVWNSLAAGRLDVVMVYGGSPMTPQQSKLRAGSDVTIGTPGRLLDLNKRGDLRLDRLRFLVLDEADQMLEIGFKDEMEQIFDAVYAGSSASSSREAGGQAKAHGHQTMLFSATLPSWVQAVARKFLRADKRVDIDLVTGQALQTAPKIRHLGIASSPASRRAAVGAIVGAFAGRSGKSIVFTETKKEADELGSGGDITVATGVLHGDIAQATREQTFQAFRSGRVQCLVATNVAARGLDIPSVDLVVMCHPPDSVETYVHRSGRTGRAGNNGTCVVLYAQREASALAHIERRAGLSFERAAVPQPKDLVRAACQDLLASVSSVDSSAIELLQPLVRAFLQQHPNVTAESAFTAAMAVLAGVTRAPPPRSMLTSSLGFQTFLVKAGGGQQVVTAADADKLIREVLHKAPAAAGAAARGSPRLLKDRSGCLIDVPQHHVAAVQVAVAATAKRARKAAAGSGGKVAAGAVAVVCELERLPALVESSFVGRGMGGGWGGGRGWRGGPRNGYGSGWRGGGGARSGGIDRWRGGRGDRGGRSGWGRGRGGGR